MDVLLDSCWLRWAETDLHAVLNSLSDTDELFSFMLQTKRNRSMDRTFDLADIVNISIQTVDWTPVVDSYENVNWLKFILIMIKNTFVHNTNILSFRNYSSLSNETSDRLQLQ